MRRRVTRIALGGLLTAAAVLAAGTLLTRNILGADDDEARVRIQTEVRSAFDVMTRALQQAAAEAQSPADLRQATREDREGTVAATRLFERASAIVEARAPIDLALTIFGADGRPLAWAGRATELPADRLRARDAWFLAPEELGLRLVYVTSIDQDAAVVGRIAVERPLDVLRGDGSGVNRRGNCNGRDAFCFPTRLGPVTIRLPGEGARPSARGSNGETPDDLVTFDVETPSGEPLFTAAIRSEDLAATRARWWRATTSTALMVIAVTLLLIIGPLLDWRNHARTARTYALASCLVAGLIIAGRWVLSVASPADWSDSRLFSATTYASDASGLLPRLLTSPFDFWLTWLAAAALVAVAFFGVERWRVLEARRRRPVDGGQNLGGYLATQLLAGTVVAAGLLVHELLLQDTITQATPDLLHFSLQPWDASRTALQVGLIVLHATVATFCVLVLRAAVVRWRLPRHKRTLLIATVVCWIAPLALVSLTRRAVFGVPPVALTAVVVFAALNATHLKARYRHGSQAFRLMLLFLALIVPAMASYPSLFHLAGRSKAELVETNYADEALDQRKTMTDQLSVSLLEIDQIPNLAARLRDVQARIDVTDGTKRAGAGQVNTDLAFEVWRDTALAIYPITSSIELYGADRKLVSRFGYNMPEEPAPTPAPEEQGCDWGPEALVGLVTRVYAEERRVLHAGRNICSPDGKSLGSIDVHAMIDYENLPFISSPNPYRELLRPPDANRAEDQLGRSGNLSFYNRRGLDVEFVFYGWSGRPIYPTNETAWQLDDEVMVRFADSRTPIWHQLRRGDRLFNVYLRSDRFGIYALGFPAVTPLDHLVNLSELTVLAAAAYCVLLLTNALFSWVSRRTATAPALLREVRASFYRKLFLAFVAAVILPVSALAVVTRNYVANEIRSSIEQEAVRTALSARKFVEDELAQANGALDDRVMVRVSRLIDQDANVFDGPNLIATSERDLFASGLLPTRVPADVYRALQLRNQQAVVTEERGGTLDAYLVAATPLAGREQHMLTVPLTSRQQEIEAQITTLTRRLLLGALIFVLGGAFLGYWMAERISDPVNRLTRATRRISRGDLDARILARSSDELRRLVEDFNSMAGELQRQRRELERTHRIEAWAEMARQVAHDIKNPLTPIQLTAEHLRRVHADRGEPLSPVLQDCVHTILTQVRLLRQIASEFSSFASSPIARPAVVGATGLIRDIVEPYRVGLQERIRFDVDIPETLPQLFVDRGLVTRALSNLVENALHAMPGHGTLTVRAADAGDAVRIVVSDTGAGMDAEAMARAFEPYFSTKATGTGLGLTIAKRNVELNGGTIAVSSEKDKGTSVELRLPAAVTAAA